MIVLKVENEQIRSEIEKITLDDQYKGEIKFLQDNNGNWIVGKEVLDDPNFILVKDLLLAHSEEIEFAGLPLPDDMK